MSFKPGDPHEAGPCGPRQSAGRTMTREPIIIHHVYPPIPLRAFDWCAYRDGHEEDGNYGWGPTKEAAVQDLLELEEWQSE